MAGQLRNMDADSVAALDAGDTANLVCRQWLGHQNTLLARADTHPACARSEFGDGRVAEMRRAAGLPVRNAGGRGELAAPALEALL